VLKEVIEPAGEMMEQRRGGCLDVMIFNTTKREAYLGRGSAHTARFQRFTLRRLL